VLFEITLNNLRRADTGDVDEKDFIDRADILCSLGQTVLISNYQEYYKLVEYFSRYTKARMGVIMGVNNLIEVFDEKLLPPPERRHARGLRHPVHARPEDLRVPEPCFKRQNDGDHDHGEHARASAFEALLRLPAVQQAHGGHRPPTTPTCSTSSAKARCST
jgi:hypothetical protein